MNEKFNAFMDDWKIKYKKFIAYLKRDFSQEEAPPTPPDPRNLDYIVDSNKTLSNEHTFPIKILLYCVGGLILILLIWAKFAVLEEVTVGSGNVIPSTHIKSIQTLDGGVLAELYVKQGDIVKPNQMLAKLTVSDSQAEYLSTRNHYLTLLATIARLDAEAKKASTVTYPKDLKDYKDIRDSETDLFISRQKSLAERVQTLQNSLNIAKKQLNIMQPLVAKGIVSKYELLQLQGNINSIQGNISDENNKFYKDVYTELNKTQDEANILQEKMIGLQNRMNRSTITSPVHGIIKQINVTTIGGVLKQGEELMQIVPLEDTLLVEAKISPKDIAFIHPGEKAKVKFTAYDYSIYGGLDGVVDYISPDTVVDDKGNTYYLVHVRTNHSYLGSKEKPLPIIPGMIVTVDILTGKKSILEYLLKPFFKARYEALRER